MGGPIRWRMHLPASPRVVFAALATAEGRAAYWAESAEEHDGVVRFVFPGGVVHEARIVESQAPDRFVLEYFDGVARFELEDDGRGGTDLSLTHEGVERREWVETHAGWLNVLFPLKAWLAGRVDLRNHDPARSWARGYADA